MEQLTSDLYTSDLYIVPECAYAVDANTLFERCLCIPQNYLLNSLICYSNLSLLLNTTQSFNNDPLSIFMVGKMGMFDFMKRKKEEPKIDFPPLPQSQQINIPEIKEIPTIPDIKISDAQRIPQQPAQQKEEFNFGLPPLPDKNPIPDEPFPLPQNFDFTNEDLFKDDAFFKNNIQEPAQEAPKTEAKQDFVGTAPPWMHEPVMPEVPPAWSQKTSYTEEKSLWERQNIQEDIPKPKQTWKTPNQIPNQASIETSQIQPSNRWENNQTESWQTSTLPEQKIETKRDALPSASAYTAKPGVIESAGPAFMNYLSFQSVMEVINTLGEATKIVEDTTYRLKEINTDKDNLNNAWQTVLEDLEKELVSLDQNLYGG
ncbi:MAG: hypothetical protein QXK37_00330 [Candidatus Woesearchaeota archaeon]